MPVARATGWQLQLRVVGTGAVCFNADLKIGDPQRLHLWMYPVTCDYLFLPPAAAGFV